VHVVDFRGVLPPADPASQGTSGDWVNEIHPTTAGYQRLSPDYCTVVANVVAPSAAATVAATRAASAPSLAPAASPQVPPGVLAASAGTGKDTGAGATA
jgi:hypothetical protein